MGEVPSTGYRCPSKDIIDTEGLLTTSGSRIQAEHVPDTDATVTRRLREAGAVFTGKLNLSEFAMGGTVVHPYGTPRNPWDPSRTPGSSSSGSGIAAAAGMSAGTLGSDTGGSVRGPASYCGLAGIRPTYGRVSRHGVTPLSWSLDTVGPFARTVEDCALLLEVIAGHDPKDATSSRTPVPDYDEGVDGDVSGLRVGLPIELCESDVLDPEVRSAFDEAVGILGDLAGSAEPVSLPWIDLTPAPVIVVSDAEAADYHAPWLRTRADEYDENVRMRLQSGALTPATAYIRAQRIRSLVRREAQTAFETFDVLASPATPTAAPPVEVHTSGPGGVFGDLDRDLPRRTFTGPGSLAGLPTLVIPCGFTSSGLPIGMQLIGRHFDEATLFRLGHAYEQATEWHLRRPPI